MRYSLLLSSVLLVETAIACGGGPPRAVSATAGLPLYTPEEAAIFGDTLSAGVFGLPAEIPPTSDPKLEQRARRADALVRVRISTVSEESLAGKIGFSLTAIVDDEPVFGAAPGPSVELSVGPGTPALSQVRSAGTALVGRRFVLFVKAFDDGGEARLHWHGDADDPAVLKVVESARALDELRTKGHTPK